MKENNMHSKCASHRESWFKLKLIKNINPTQESTERLGNCKRNQKQLGNHNCSCNKIHIIWHSATEGDSYRNI